jgi:hypothetical protein
MSEVLDPRFLVNRWCKSRVEVSPFENEDDESLARFVCIKARTSKKEYSWVTTCPCNE